MKTKKEVIIGALALLLASAVHTVAIEGIQIAVKCRDVILSWPSDEFSGETYLVQYRADLVSTNPWTTLTNFMPPDAGTNLTFFIHSNIVVHPTCGGSAPNAMFAASSSSQSLPSMVLRAAARAARMAQLSNDLALLMPPPLPANRPKRPLKNPASATILSNSSSVVVSSADSPQPPGGNPPGENPPGGGGSGFVPETGFYRVVRNNIHLFGVTNGTVVSGAMPLIVEFGSEDTNRFLDEVFLSNNDSDDNLPGSAFPRFPLASGGVPNGVWDTTQVTNGVYTLQLGAKLDNDTAYIDAPVTVTVSNVMWTPDPWKVGGQAIYVGVQTVFTSGTWRLDVYDDQNTYLGHLNGIIDSDGYCNYPGITGPGFSLDNTDGQGNQNPSTAYTLAMTVHPPAGPPYPSLTNTVLIEPAWNFAPTYAVTCYYQPFNPIKAGYNEVRAMMEDIWNTEQAFHPNLLGNFNTPFEIQTFGDWYNVLTKVGNPYGRDFIYFGHGAANILGVGTNMTSTNTVAIDTMDIESILHNNETNPLIGTNRHPYRFVYLDGCSTADAKWPLVFGIPKQKMTMDDFVVKRGIRPRAFFGWNRKKRFSDNFVTGLLDPDFQTWRTIFWATWSERNNQGGPRHNLNEAIDDAKNHANSAAGGATLYGAEDLVIDY